MTNLERVRAAAVTALVLAGLAYASRAPYSPPGSDDAVLRLSWRLRGDRQQTCRKRTEAELNALPVHMRTPEVCSDRLIAYRLHLSVDGEARDSVTYAPAGAKGDRPIFVLRDEVLSPGTHEIDIHFTPLEAEAAQHKAPLRFTGTVHARPGQVNLITLASDGATLLLVSNPADSAVAKP